LGNILREICNRKRDHVAKQKLLITEASMLNEINKIKPTRGFLKALKKARSEKKFGLIAEIKKASPSKGLIRKNFNPVALARSYELGGATCLSVLTDEPYFQGADIFLAQARNTVNLPTIRKDFIVDPYQVVESRRIGADCILIIMACVEDSEAADFIKIAHELSMDALIEVHSLGELKRALKLSPELIGINNRNLKTLKVDLGVTERLAPLIDESATVISESGLYNHEDLLRMKALGISSFLVGESLMREKDVECATKRILGM